LATIKAVRKLCAFLDLIAWSEGTQTHPLTKDDGYDVIVSGVDGIHVFADYSCHPFSRGREPITVRNQQPARYDHEDGDSTKPVIQVHGTIPPIISTASGRYQITLLTWEHVGEAIKAGTFSPMNQDLAAIKLIEQAHAIEAIMNDALPHAFELLSNTWASLPGNLYGQGGHSVRDLKRYYESLLYIVEG